MTEACALHSEPYRFFYGESLTETQANMFNTSPRLASAESIFFFLACESGDFEKEVDHMKSQTGE